MIVTVLSVLGAVGVGAWIFWLASRGTRLRPVSAPMLNYAPPQQDMKSRVDQIRGYIRAANGASTPIEGLTNAGSARALLADAEATYGDGLRSACDPDRLRELIQKVSDRYARALGPVS